MPTVLIRVTLGLVSLLLSAGFVAADSQFAYYNNGGGITILGYHGTPSGWLVIPEMIDDLPVTEIGDGAFSNDWGHFDTLTRVEIPETVFRIRSNAFFLCHGITKINLPRSLTRFDAGAFSFTGLTDIFIPQYVTTIEGRAFSGCRNLTTIRVHTSNPSYSSIDGVLFDKQALRGF